MQFIITVSYAFSRFFQSEFLCRDGGKHSVQNYHYQQWLIILPSVSATSYGRATLVEEEVANKLFVTFLFSDKNVGIQFLNDVGLLRSSMACSV